MYSTLSASSFSIHLPRAAWRGEARAIASELRQALASDAPSAAWLENGYFAELLGRCIEAAPAELRGALARVTARLVRLSNSSLDEAVRLFDDTASARGTVFGIALVRRSGVVIGDLDVLSPNGSRVDSVPLNDPLDAIVMRSQALTVGPLYWIDPSPGLSGLADLLALTLSADTGVGSLIDSWET